VAQPKNISHFVFPSAPVLHVCVLSGAVLGWAEAYPQTKAMD